MITELEKRFWIVSFLLRAGIGFSFVYAALSSLLNPDAWIGFLPHWVHTFGAQRILTAFSIYQILLALWVVSGKWIFTSAFVAFVTMGGIILYNLGALDLVFRDVSVLVITLVIMIMHSKENGLLPFLRIGNKNDEKNMQ